ncbi:hypothetical protein JUJ52_03230 [Virgibacillus sp. AGTR]|uniref:hypothetical protein n=1 Tax=Virgibacillus sp. AGTR TaxID=2812055 RepID=UPI001D1610DA|nr:hypothetical protein [Virgibacillus sp. AGTR]MCC2248970.1 hypothetical protein [Virgibacillus sp. AGTR]
MSYILQHVSKSYCPNCNKKVKLLCPKDTLEIRNLPAFYICFDCNLVDEIGVGEVKYTSE